MSQFKENIYKSKALRGELYDKFIQILSDDDVSERRHYARELANYAREMLSSVGAAYDLSSNTDNLERCTLRYVASVYLQPREDFLAQEGKGRARRDEKGRDERSRAESWGVRWDMDRYSDRQTQAERHGRDLDRGTRQRERASRVAAIQDSGTEAADDEEDTRVALVRGNEQSRREERQPERRKDERKSDQRPAVSKFPSRIGRSREVSGSRRVLRRRASGTRVTAR